MIARMLLTSLAAALFTVLTATAQSIALGERVPEFRNAAWLDGRAPQQAPLTWIVFFHSSNRACSTSLEQLGKLHAASDGRLRVVIVTCEPTDRIEPLLRPRLNDRTSVALDPEGRIFAAYGVSYVPFGVLTDGRNRALWQGNALRLDEPTFRQTIR